jgi:hypothetical protein
MDKAMLKSLVLLLAGDLATACGARDVTTNPYGTPIAGTTGGASYAGTGPVPGYGGTSGSYGGATAVGGTFAGRSGGGNKTTAASGKGGTTATGGKNGTTASNGGKSGTTATGGSGAKAGNGTSGTGGSNVSTVSIFPKAYTASCASGFSHLPGTGCKDGACHFAFVAAGTTYASGGSTAAPSVEVGIKSGSDFLYACSDTAGNFIFRSGNVQWANADIRIRSAKGEKKKINPVTHGNCNTSGCHDESRRLTAP